MSTAIYCSGVFVGQRVLDESIQLNKGEENELKFTLCLTPTKEYPSLFGAAYNQSSSHSNILHGTYNGITQEAEMIEIQNGISIYKYQCKLTIDKSNKMNYLYGTWKSSMDSSLFGKLAMVCVVDQPSDISSGIWIGQSIPDEELEAFCLPINPIRWCFTIFKENNHNWKLFGSGYFNDSGDIPGQPLLFFSLDGQGTLDDMTVIKKYINLTTDYTVEYRGEFLPDNEQNLQQFQGRWSNSLAGSYGSFVAAQRQLNPLTSYRLDICICEVCRNPIHPGDNRWCCFQCHFSSCSGGCHLNSIAINHQHKLIVDILPNQTTAHGNTSLQLVENAFQVFDKTPFLTYRSFQTDQFISMSYGQMSIKCFTLAKYWKQFVRNANDANRPIILLICDTSPAYICCLLTGICLQSVLFPINGSLNIDAIQHILKMTNPSIIVIGQQYLEKISSILSSDQKQISMIIYQNEEQFDQIPTNNNQDIISLTKALQFGEQNEIDINPSIDLSTKTISAILSTSGSTGYPKGAIFTEELIIPNDSFTLISPFIRIDYQPFDPVLLLSLMSTMKYGSCRGLTNLNHMWNDIKLIKPTSIGLTPSLWNFIYKNYLTKLNRNSTPIEKEQIEREIREDLGGRLSVGTSGGGSISPTVFHFIINQLKIDLVDIYGCRECGNISKNGFIYPGIDVKLIPVRDIEEFDGITQGEICVHSPKMIQGYWQMEHNSAFITIQGKIYYKTGDIGQVEGNTIRLLDRSGTMIKNSMGEWISPVKIENIIEQLSQVSLAFVMGHSNHSYLIAIICPSESYFHFNELDMLQLIRFHCAHFGLNGPEIPQRIFLEKNLIWNQQNGLFKEKKSRHALAKYYAEMKNNIYNQLFIPPQTIDQNQQLNEDFIRILEKSLNRTLNGQINGENTFVEIGGDSLSISLFCQLYSEKGISINSSIVYNHSLDHLQHLLTNQHLIYDQIIEDIHWKDQSKLPTHFKDLIRNSKDIIPNRNILLTGSTGFLGPILLYEITEKSDQSTIIYCLIRAKDAEHAKQRLKQDLEKCQRINLIDWNRIECIDGDISKEYLGLNSHLYNQLIEQIGFVYHNASMVNLDMTYKSLKSANVKGTLNILEFALRSNSKFIYTSSVSALSGNPQLKEDANGWISLTSNEMNKKDGYGQTKVVVEQILKQAKDLGANILIIRPGTISSDTLTGYSNLNDFINILFRIQFQLNTIVQNSNINFHFVPVDYCAKVIVALARNEETRGKCFNLYGDPFNISKIYQIFLEKFPEKKFNQIKQNQWKEFLLNNLSWTLKDQLASFQFVQDDQQLKQQGVNMKMTKDFLENKLNIKWFRLDEQYFIKSIDYLIQQEFFN